MRGTTITIPHFWGIRGVAVPVEGPTIVWQRHGGQAVKQDQLTEPTFAGLQASVRQVTNVAGRRPESAALANLGMLCLSGLSARQLARCLPPLIRGALAADPIGLFWCDAAGAMQDAWVENPGFLSSQVLHSGNIWRQQNPDAWPRFADNVLAGPVAGVLLPYQNDGFWGSDFYKGSYATIGVRHVMDAVVHDGCRPHGCFLIMRSASAGAFLPDDVDLARDIAELVLPCFLADSQPPPSSRRYPGGLAIVASDGDITYCDRAAHQSLWTLARAGDRPMIDDVNDDVEKLLRRFCGEDVDLARSLGHHEVRRFTRWGNFALRYDRTDHGQVVISFDQLLPFAAHVAMMIARLDLSPRRVIACWLLVRGLTRKEIAWTMNLSAETVNDHLDQVFAALGVNTAVAAMRHFSD